jgi:hypothetical protein
VPKVTIRTKFIDYDARRNPKTNRSCVMCQKDIRPNEKCRRVFVTQDMEALHPKDLSRYVPKPSDPGWLLIGNKCAKILGLEWSVVEPKS